jgi:hypothetical protein
MVLQSSNAISFSNIQTEFGGINPISLSEYYLNGLYSTGTGAAGIPTSGQISLNNFYGKSKVVSSGVPTAVETSYTGIYANVFAGGQYGSAYEALSGCAGANLSRSDVSTFNNIGAVGLNRPMIITYMNLILQARAGNTIRITIAVTVAGSWTEYQRCFINLGTGYNLIGTTSAAGSTQQNFDYVIPAGTVAGNYAIACTNDYGASQTTYRTVNYYSLHIF